MYIGINTMKAAGPEGISFAIPIDSAWPVLEQLRMFRQVRRPYLGVKMINFDPHVSALLKSRNPNFPQDVEFGVIVTHVAPSSPAEHGGLQPGDIIISLDSNKIQSTNDVLKVLGFEVGKKHYVVVRRGQTTKTLTVTSEALPAIIG